MRLVEADAARQHPDRHDDVVANDTRKIQQRDAAQLRLQAQARRAQDRRRKQP
jgi:hypothetical protein